MIVNIKQSLCQLPSVYPVGMIRWCAGTSSSPSRSSNRRQTLCGLRLRNSARWSDGGQFGLSMLDIAA